MARIDDILIERLFSPLAGVLEHRLGIGQWRAAIECLNGHVALYIGGVAFAIAGKGLRDGIFAELLVAFLWLAIMEAVRKVALRQASSSMGVQTARLGEWHFRCILLLMLPASLCYVGGKASALYAASLALLLAHLYFKACDVPPPERGRSLAFGGA
jgi:hypothetical protein